MGFSYSKKKKVFPEINIYKFTNNENKYVDYNDYKTLKVSNTNLRLEINKLNIEINKLVYSDFECIVCYCKNDSLKKKIKCGHDICINCYYIIKNKKCPYCNKHF